MAHRDEDEEQVDSGHHEPDSALGILHEMQQAFVRMILGIGKFLFSTLPMWFYSLFHNLFRIIGKSFVVLAFALLWALVVFGPGAVAYYLEALGSVPTTVAVGLWALIALTGSFRTLGKLRSRGSGVGCVWAVGIIIALAATGLLVYAHIQQAEMGKKRNVPTTGSYYR